LDSIVRNIDIPKMYLARVADGGGNDNFDFECIDGKQRMATLLNFYKPESGTETLRVEVAGDKYTYKVLRKEFPQVADKIDNFELTFVIYPPIDDDDFLREIFRRLQLGVRLNSGELLKTYSGTLRDFVYKEMGKDAPFLRHTNLSEKGFSRQFTLAQTCINSFARDANGEFVRARYDDLADFFKDNYNLGNKDENLVRIREVLKLLDKHYGEKAASISSRAAAVSAYLFVEGLYIDKKLNVMPRFVEFYVALLEEIKENLRRLTVYEQPTNARVLEEFQKYISQASAEAYSIKRRDLFLDKAFAHYLNPKTKGQILSR
jgi:hypothetical protein